MEDDPTRSSAANEWKTARYGCFIGGIALLVVVVVAIVVGAKPFVAFGISSDITEFIRFVEQSDLETDTKQDLRNRFERIRDRARQGHHVGFWVWLYYDKSIRNYIEDGEITERDLESLIREIDRLEHTP